MMQILKKFVFELKFLVDTPYYVSSIIIPID